MRHFALIGILAAAGILLAACNPPPDDSSSTTQAVRPAASTAPDAPQGSSPTVEPPKPAEAGGEAARPQRDTASLPKVPAAGEPLPTFKFTTLDGKTHSIEEFVGRPLLVNMWMINCPPCKMELPEFVKFYGEHKEKGLEIITLNVQDSAQALQEFMEKTQEMPWVTGFNAGTLARSWGVRGVPTSYFVNSDGAVVEIKLGAASREYLDGLLPAWMGVQK